MYNPDQMYELQKFHVQDLLDEAARQHTYSELARPRQGGTPHVARYLGRLFIRFGSWLEQPALPIEHAGGSSGVAQP